jgi:hypothetical protein
MFLIIASLLIWILKKQHELVLVDTIHIESDEKTIFVDSTNPNILIKNVAAVEADGADAWEKLDSRYGDSFIEAKWIADKKRASVDDARNGYSYKFERSFEMPKKILDRINYADLELLCDDDCDVILNTHHVASFRGFNKLHRKVIKNEFLLAGKNIITFLVTNSKSNLILPEGNPSNKNPYGVKYIIEIEHKRI